MKKRNCVIWILLCAVLLFSGCQMTEEGDSSLASAESEEKIRSEIGI